MTHLELVLAVILGVVVLALVAVTRDQRNPVSLLQLVVEARTGRLSLSRVGQLVALIVSSWGFVVLVRADKLTEWYFTSYMIAWAGARLASQFLDTKKAGGDPADAR
jgi:hypothetical protein